jgi:TonB-linked SusC/RagA family outer membrane protein
MLFIVKTKTTEIMHFSEQKPPGRAYGSIFLKLLKMKLTVLLLFSSLLQLSAHTYSQTLTLHMKNVRISKVFTEINRQTGFMFFFKDDLISKAGKIDVDVRNARIEDVLKSCFEGLPVTFTIVDKTIVVKEKAVTLGSTVSEVAAGSIIRGRVTDSTGNPLAGATILVRETNVAAVSDAAGNFSVDAKPGYTLVVTYVGYDNLIYTVGASDNIMLVLAARSNSLKSIALVYTGYQTLPKERSAGSYSSVSGEEFRNKSISNNVLDRIEGLVPGLSVNYGAGNEKFMVRGLTSISGARAPLIVVDGVPMADQATLTTLVNPEDVESVTVLRDATAASIWGAAAANGVVVIETKKGKTATEQQKIRVKFNSFFSYKGMPDQDYQNMMSTGDFLRTSKEVFSATNYPWATVTNFIGSTPVVPPHERIQYDLARGLINASAAAARFDSLSGYDNRGQVRDNLMQAGQLMNGTLAFDGGGKFHSYYGSLAYTLDKNDRRTDLSRYQMNLRQNFNISPAVKLDLITNIGYEQSEDFLLPSLPYGTNNYLPYAMFADPSGQPLSQAYLKRQEEFRAISETQSLIDLDYVPLHESARTKNRKTNFSTRINAGLTVKLFKGLTYEGRVQYQQSSLDGYEYYNKDSYRVRDELVYFTKASPTAGGIPTYYLPSSGGHYMTQNNKAVGWTLRNQLNFDRVFDTKHQVTVIAGTELRNNLNTSVQTMRRGYDFQTQTYVLYNEDSLAVRGVAPPVNFLTGRTTNNLLTSKPVTYTETERRFLSGYSNAAYTYKRRYTLNASIRFDQSNLFGSDRSLQYKPIWSAGGAWNLSKESFFKVRQVSNLSLRLTYGLGGNAPNPGFGGPYDIVGAVNVPYFSNLGIGYTVLVPRNEKIAWERTATTNAGVDFSIFNSRISGSVDVYRKYTTDLLGYQPADPTSGWSFAYNNLGDLENKGFEMDLRSENITNKRFSWTTGLTLSYNKNRIVSLKTPSPLSATQKVNSTFVEGYSAYGLFAYDYIGLNASGNPMALKANGKDTARRSADLTVNDPVYMGTTQPLWYGGITNTLRYSRFTLSFLVVYNLGHVMRRDVNQFYTGRLGANIPSYVNDRWMQAGDEAKTDVPRYEGNTAQHGLRFTNLYTQANRNVVSASYAKVRDLTFSYDLSGNAAGKLGMTDCSVYVQVNNIMLWRANGYGIDPEYYNLRDGVRTNAMPAFYTVGFRTAFK